VTRSGAHARPVVAFIERRPNTADGLDSNLAEALIGGVEGDALFTESAQSAQVTLSSGGLAAPRLASMKVS